MDEVKPIEELKKTDDYKLKRFHNHLDESKKLDLNKSEGKIFQYRYGSYMVYEANNKTK